MLEFSFVWELKRSIMHTFLCLIFLIEASVAPAPMFSLTRGTLLRRSLQPSPPGAVGQTPLQGQDLAPGPVLWMVEYNAAGPMSTPFLNPAAKRFSGFWYPYMASGNGRQAAAAPYASSSQDTILRFG
uniref:Uncharacterized protein n=1 Tax=Romanomermis culicivorax TaxID=13658 RepID=A0A915KC99_ROMCU